jgi:dehydrogenase/reductase SDR family protein 12
MFMIRVPTFLALGMRRFTKSGYVRASKLFEQTDTSKDLTGKHVMVTGGNQGIGYEASLAFARRGATVHLIARNAERGRKAVDMIISETGNANVFLRICDVSSLSDIGRLTAEYVASGLPLHVLVNNAGVMVTEAKSVDGYELNFATNTLGSYAFTRALEPVLKSSAPSRVIFVSSGGALTEPLVVDDLQGDRLRKDSNFGQTQYARDKRRQVVIAEKLSQEYASSGISVYSMHPGWCDTSGVLNSMPSFHERFKSNLRSPAEGADTIVWLAMKDTKDLEPGGFYLDRTPQSKHLPFAGTSYTNEEASSLVMKLDNLARSALST